MRISIVGPTFPFRGGIAQYTTLLTQHLRESHDVQLISFSRQYPAFIFPGKSELDPTETPLSTDAEFSVDSLNPFTWVKAAKQISTFTPDIVILQWWVSYWALYLYVTSALLTVFGKCRIVFIAHNSMPHESTMIDRFAIRMAMTNADKIVTQAKSDQGILQQIFPHKTIHSVKMPTFEKVGGQSQKELDLPIPENKPLILFCGLIREYKGLDILLNAMPQILDSVDVHLAVVGEIWEQESLYFDQIKQLELAENLTLENTYVSDERLSAYIKAASIVVLPYRSASQSAVIQLAFGHDTPVITTNVGGLPDVVSHGETGLIVEPENPTVIAEAVISFFQDQLETPFKQNIESRKEEFSWERFSSQLLSFNQ